MRGCRDLVASLGCPTLSGKKFGGLSQTLRHLSSWGTIGPFHSTYQRTKTAQHANLKQDMWICKGNALYTYTCIDTGSISTIINVYMTFEVCCIFLQTGGILSNDRRYTLHLHGKSFWLARFDLETLETIFLTCHPLCHPPTMLFHQHSN